MKPPAPDEEVIDRVHEAGGMILSASGEESWIEVFYEGDLMHTKRIDLPSDTLFDIFVEGIPHKSTIYEHPRILIYFDGPCDLEVCREGSKIIVRGIKS